jgi:chromosome partitioning protein
VTESVSEKTIIHSIERAALQTTFVIVDLEGTASMIVANAISRADLVIIPTQGSQLDAVEAVKAVQLVRGQGITFGRRIRYSVLFTRTNAAIRPRTLQNVEAQFAANSIPMFGAQIHERDAYRAIFSFGGTLATLDPSEVPNLATARANALAFTSEVVMLLKDSAKPKSRAAFAKAPVEPVA